MTICEAGSGQKCFVSMSDTDSSNKDCNVTMENRRQETNYQTRNGSAPPNGNIARPPTSLPLIVEKDTSSCEMKEAKIPPPPVSGSLRIKPQPPPVPIRQTTLSLSSVPLKNDDHEKRADDGYSRYVLLKSVFQVKLYFMMCSRNDCSSI